MYIQPRPTSLPLPLHLFPRGQPSSLRPTFSCPPSNSESGDSRDTWQNNNIDVDSSTTSTSTTATTSDAAETDNPALQAIGEEVLKLVPQTSAGAEVESRGSRRRSELGRRALNGKWYQGGRCMAAVEEVKMGQGWFIGATGPVYGTYGCNLTDADGVSEVTWHSAQAAEDNFNSILCVWTNLDSSKEWSASVVNSPSDMTGHGWMWVDSFNGFEYHANEAELGLFTLCGQQTATIPGPTSTSTAADDSSITATVSSTTTSSASADPSSTSITVKTDDDSDSPLLSLETVLWLTFLAVACLACLTVGCLCFRKRPPAPPPTAPSMGKKKKRTLVLESGSEEEGEEKALGRKRGSRGRYVERRKERDVEEGRMRDASEQEEKAEEDEEQQPLFEKKRKRRARGRYSTR